jgi:hypothetical protein
LWLWCGFNCWLRGRFGLGFGLNFNNRFRCWLRFRFGSWLRFNNRLRARFRLRARLDYFRLLRNLWSRVRAW